MTTRRVEATEGRGVSVSRTDNPRCVGCERFFTDGEVSAAEAKGVRALPRETHEAIDLICPDCSTKTVLVRPIRVWTEHVCGEPGRGLVKIDHPANKVDWNEPHSRQSYQVYRCEVCGDYWGCRFQYDTGTGHDDRWQCFGPNIADVHRHY